MRALLFGVSLILGSAIPAFGEYLMSSEDLQSACTKSSGMPVCLAYISGVTDDLTHLNELAGLFQQQQDPNVPTMGCIRARIPDKPSAEDERDLFLEYLKNRPDALKFPAVVVLGFALSRAYPCPSKS